MLYVTIFCLFRRSFFEKRCLCSRKLWLTEVIDDELHLRTTVEVGILAHVEVLDLFIERRDVFDPSCQTVDGNLLLAVGGSRASPAPTSHNFFLLSYSS